MQIKITVQKDKLIYAIVLGVICGVGIYMSLLSRVNTIQSMEPDITNRVLFIWRTIYKSLNDNRLRSFLISLSAVAIIYIGHEIYCKFYQKIVLAIFAAIFSFVQVLCISYDNMNSWDAVFGVEEEDLFIYHFRSGYKIISYAIVVYYIVKIAKYLIENYLANTEENTADCKFNIKRWLAFSLIVFICWLPYFFIFYPGTSNIDTCVQILQYMGQPTYILDMTPNIDETVFITNHHPYILTVIFGRFAKLGMELGDINKGIAIYTLCQMICMALTLAGAVEYLAVCKVSIKRRLIMLGIIALFPIFGLYSVCMVKDTLFGMFALIMTMLMNEVARTKGRAFKSVLFNVLMLFSAIGMLFTKSYGYYMLLIVIILYIVFYYRYIPQIAITIALPAWFYKAIFLAIILPSLNVAPVGMQEALSLPFQQTARYVVEYNDEVTKEEKEVLNRIIPYKKWALKYDPNLADQVKSRYNQDATEEDLAAYKEVWKQMYKKHKDAYIQATINNTYQYYYVDKISSMNYYDFNDYIQTRDKDGSWEPYYISNMEETKDIRYIVNQIVLIIEEIPIVNIFCSIGLLPWLLLFLVIFHVFNKSYAYIIGQLIPILTFGVCLVSPDNGNIRYIIPIVLTWPFLYLIAFSTNKCDNK